MNEIINVFFCVVRTGGVFIYVLVACEESQAVCIAFRLKGHIAFSADIQSSSGGFPEWHIKGDVIPLLNGHCSFITESGDSYTISSRWDMIIAFPPCTYLTRAGAANFCRDRENRINKGFQAADFFMTIYNADCDKIVIENPVPMKIFCLPSYTQIINPYEFGHPFTKPTCLWIKGVWCLIPDNVVYDVPLKSYVYSGSSTSKRRSKTFTGVAHAMAEQWG